MEKTITILNLPIEPYYNMDNLVCISNILNHNCNNDELDPSVTLENLYAMIHFSDLVIIPGQKVFKYFGDGLMKKNIFTLQFWRVYFV